MVNKHKDLPTGSQAWADELDQALDTIKKLEEVVKRLSANAGLDFSNPGRGINPGDTPSIQNPVGQKLSSLADVGTYNVADKQVLTWSQQGQKWMPVTPSAGGSIDVSGISYSHQDRGYGVITEPNNYAYTAANSGRWGGQVEVWATDAVYIGQSGPDFNNAAIIQLTGGGYDPWVSMMASNCELLVVNNNVSVDGGTFTIFRVTTATRPVLLTGYNKGASVWDQDLGIPIWWNGTAWTNALGTAV